MYHWKVVTPTFFYPTIFPIFKIKKNWFFFDIMKNFNIKVPHKFKFSISNKIINSQGIYYFDTRSICVKYFSNIIISSFKKIFFSYPHVYISFQMFFSPVKSGSFLGLKSFDVWNRGLTWSQNQWTNVSWNQYEKLFYSVIVSYCKA